jgi:hypothetical protein
MRILLRWLTNASLADSIVGRPLAAGHGAQGAFEARALAAPRRALGSQSYFM